MKLSTIHLEDFGPYVDQTINFDQPLNIVRGDLAQGKTKLSQAIQLSFAKICDGIDGKGSGFRDKIRLGEDKAIITAGLETAQGAIQIRTTYGPGKRGRDSVVIAGEGSSAVNLAAGFEQYLQRSEERFSCVLDSEYFTRPGTDQRAILASLVLPTHHDFDAKMVALVEKHLGKVIDWNASPVAVIDKVFGDKSSGVYNARTQAKAALGAIYIPQKPLQPQYPAELVQQKLLALRERASQEAKKVKRSGTAQTGRLERELEQVAEKLAAAFSERTAAIAKRGEIEAEMVDGAALASLKQIAGQRSAFATLQTAIDALSGDIQGMKDVQAIFEGLRSNCRCPTCGQGITPEFINAEIAENKGRELELTESRAQLTQQQKALGDIKAAEEAIQKQEKSVAAKLEQVKKVTETTERIATLEKQSGDAKAALETAKASESEPVDTTAIDAVNTEISEWEARLAPAVQYESTLKQIETATKQWQDKKNDVDELETLCEHFGPKGIKATLLQKHIGGFNESVNRVLNWWGYSATLSFEPYSFDVVTPETTPKTLPVKELSGSELFRFLVALQCAIAVYSKIKMVLIDKADILIDAHRGKLFAGVKHLLDTGLLEKAFIFVADKRREAPKQEGVGFYLVEKGKVERLS
jgi:ubiquinone biosynthesis protein UbiJ